MSLSLVQPNSQESPSYAIPADERRVHTRLTVSELSWLNAVKLKYGPAVSVIDLSSGGAQIETTSYKLHPGSTVVVEITGDHGEFAIPAQVLRCQVAELLPRAIYRGALLFKHPFSLPSAEVNGDAAEAVAASPIQEHARLCLALRRFYESYGQAWTTSDYLTGAGAGVLGATLAMMESPSGREGASPFPRELSRMFKAIAEWVEDDTSVEELLVEIAERLRRAVPARAIRLLDGTALKPQHADVVYFDVPAVDGVSRGRLLVEFPRGCRLEEWHFKFLKTAAQLIALTQDVDRIRQSAAARSREDALIDPLGWHRIVVRYADGRLLKGFGHDFSPAKGLVHVWPTPDSPHDAHHTVPLKHLKAVFFVHDLAGNLDGSLHPIDVSSNAGRKVIVTFLDGEALAGTTLNYTSDGPGFFLAQTDSKSNNERVFVVRAAIAKVHFP